MSTITVVDLRATLTAAGFTVVDPANDPYKRKWELCHPAHPDVCLIGLVTTDGHRREFLQFFTWQANQPANTPGNPFHIAIEFEYIHDPALLHTLLQALATGFKAISR